MLRSRSHLHPRTWLLFAVLSLFASLFVAPAAEAACPCSSVPGFDNFCAYPPSTANCPMTSPGGYCDPNGDRSYTDGDWVRGYNEYRAACSSTPTCRCSGGTDYWGRAVDPATTYCGFRVCGRDNQNYECRSTGWAAVGGSPCASTPTCRCSGGTDYWGRTVDPTSTYCGFRVCGRDNQNYECRSTGWAAVGGSPCAGTTTCRCSGGTDYWGRAVDPASTYCGFRVCGRDDQYYECRAAGWAAVGGVPCHTTTSNRDCFGLAVNINGPLGSPSGTELSTLGVHWVRSLVVAGREPAFTVLHNRLPAGVQVVALFNHESFAAGRCGLAAGQLPPGTCNSTVYADEYSNALVAFARGYGDAVDAYEIWNEPDQPASAIDAATLALALQQSRQKLAAAGLSKTLLLGGPNGQSWQTYLSQLMTALGSNPTSHYDGLAFHPYATSIAGVPALSTLPRLDATLALALEGQGSQPKPLWLTEFGIRLEDIGGTVPQEVQAQYLSEAYRLFGNLGANQIAHAFWFAWSDYVQSLSAAPMKFGLVDEKLNRRKAWEAYRQCATSTCPTTYSTLTPPPRPSTSCPCSMYDATIDNFCLYGANLPACPETRPFGICDPNGDGAFETQGWINGFNSYNASCLSTTCTQDTCGAR